MKSKFAERISLLISEKGVQKKQLAIDMHVTPQTVSRWCNGHLEPEMPTITLLSDYFRVSTDYLLGNTDFRNYTNNDPFYMSKIDLEVKSSNSLIAYLESKNYIIEFIDEGSQDLQKVNSNKLCRTYEIKHNFSVQITSPENEVTTISSIIWEDFISEIQEYLNFKMLQIIKKGERQVIKNDKRNDE